MTFGRVLREAGLEIGPGRLADALTGLDRVHLSERDDVYWTLRLTLVSRREELDAFDRAFAAWFLRAPLAPPQRQVALRRQEGRRRPSEGSRLAAAQDAGDATENPIGWSEH